MHLSKPHLDSAATFFLFFHKLATRGSLSTDKPAMLKNDKCYATKVVYLVCGGCHHDSDQPLINEQSWTLFKIHRGHDLGGLYKTLHNT